MTEITHCQECINKDEESYWSCFNHDCYYWLKTKEEDNPFGYSYQIHQRLTNNDSFYNMCDLIDKCVFYSIWLHNWLYHPKDKNNLSNEYQSEYTKLKNDANFLISLKIKNKARQLLLEEIRDFSLCPPQKSGDVCGFEYKLAKNRFENLIKK